MSRLNLYFLKTPQLIKVKEIPVYLNMTGSLLKHKNHGMTTVSMRILMMSVFCNVTIVTTHMYFISILCLFVIVLYIYNYMYVIIVFDKLVWHTIGQ